MPIRPSIVRHGLVLHRRRHTYIPFRRRMICWAEATCFQTRCMVTFGKNPGFDAAGLAAAYAGTSFTSDEIRRQSANQFRQIAVVTVVVCNAALSYILWLFVLKVPIDRPEVPLFTDATKIKTAGRQSGRPYSFVHLCLRYGGWLLSFWRKRPGWLHSALVAVVATVLTVILLFFTRNMGASTTTFRWNTGWPTFAVSSKMAAAASTSLESHCCFTGISFSLPWSWAGSPTR